MPYVVTRDHIIIILSWYYGDTLPGDGPADQQDDDPDDPTNRARPSAGFVVFYHKFITIYSSSSSFKSTNMMATQ